MNESRVSIIALGPNQWFGPWMNRQQILSRLAKSFDVLYSGPLKSHWEATLSTIAQGPIGFEWCDSNGVQVCRPPSWLINVPSKQTLSKTVINFHSRQLVKNARYSDHCLYLYRPEYYHYVSAMRPKYTVYHIYDAYDTEPDWESGKRLMHEALVERADLVVASSAQMADRLLSGLGCENKLLIVNNGVDFGAFSQAGLAVPPDLGQIPSPRVGYTGRLNNKVDFELIDQLASLHPNVNFVLVGPEVDYTAETSDVVERCKRNSNVYFLGEKSVTEIPAYINHMDVNLMCYKIDRSSWSFYGYPLKMHEYLAAGKPVVSAGLATVLEFEDVIHIAETVEQWSQAIEQCLAERDQHSVDRRVSIAAQNSWDARVEVLAEELIGLFSGARK